MVIPFSDGAAVRGTTESVARPPKAAGGGGGGLSARSSNAANARPPSPRPGDGFAKESPRVAGKDDSRLERLYDGEGGAATAKKTRAVKHVASRYLSPAVRKA